MPQDDLPQSAVDEAKAAVEFAQHVRRRHRRRTARTSDQRARDIEIALTRLKDAMKPLRSAQGRFQYAPSTAAAEQRRQTVRDCSENIQKERRKLWKMRASSSTPSA